MPLPDIGTETVAVFLASNQDPPPPSESVRTRYSTPLIPAASDQLTVTVGLMRLIPLDIAAGESVAEESWG
jgi:hypothetical protein